MTGYTRKWGFFPRKRIVNQQTNLSCRKVQSMNGLNLEEEKNEAKR